MARISGVDLPKNKRIEIALTYIYGIGRTSANKILAETGINPDTRVKDLTGGNSLESNIQLVYNNARLAAKTACALQTLEQA